jgi:hypothetical protein
MATTALHTMVIILWYESHQNEMRHNFWKEREILSRSSSVLLLPNFKLKKYDFNLYKGFFMEKKWPKFAKFLW